MLYSRSKSKPLTAWHSCSSYGLQSSLNLAMLYSPLGAHPVLDWISALASMIGNVSHGTPVLLQGLHGPRGQTSSALHDSTCEALHH